MLTDFFYDVWVPATLVVASVYALVFRLPAVLLGRAREEYFLQGFQRSMIIMWLISVIASIVMLDMEALVNMVLWFLIVGTVSIVAVPAFIIYLCNGRYSEYYDLWDALSVVSKETTIREGVRRALRDYEAERRNARAQSRR